MPSSPRPIRLPRTVAHPAGEGAPVLSPAAAPTLMLALGTIGFFVNFWAWALVSPLGSQLRDELRLTSFQQAVLVAVPVLVGSLGRIPVGALTDKLGARVMFPAVSLLTTLPVLFVGLAGSSYPRLLLGGLFLGLGGTAFAVGIPLVNAWYPPHRRGLALGLFGMGTGGTALSAFTTVRLADAYGRAFPFLLVAAVLVLYSATAWTLLRDAPGRRPAGTGLVTRTWATLRMKVTLQLSALYALGFGGFVAFSVYPPTYLRNAYALSPADAANRTAGFVVLAVLMRPVGGWLSDRWHPVPVLTACFSAAAGLAVLAALEPPLLPGGPNMATAQAIPATSGDYGCTWSRPCTACRSDTR